MKPKHAIAAAAIIALLALGACIAPASAQQATQEAKQQQMPDLEKGLKAVPGCLGVETARTKSGKTVIFAWFKDKKAVLDWYYSDTHQAVMQKLAPDYDAVGPLEHVADDAGSIMAIASLTPAKESHFKEMKLPVSQIAIELYAPLPGGAALGGRFAPEALKVPHLRQYKSTPTEAAKRAAQDSKPSEKPRGSAK